MIFNDYNFDQLSFVIKMITQGSVIETERLQLLPRFDEGRLRHFDSYVDRLRSVFHRADQALRFRAYLRGLLEPIERKNVESIAAAASQVMMVEADLSQALQHFVSHSPWDSRRLLSKIRELNREYRLDPESVWVIHDMAFSKKGQHSVGVMRQHARTLGKKINCQVGVFIVQVGPAGFFPLASRLYLPANWLKEHPEGVAKNIPEEFRQFASKGEIALSLIEELQRDGETPRPLVLEAGYLGDNDFLAAMDQQNLRVSAENQWLEAALRHSAWLMDQLGLDHFEGRTWHGWHHHISLVLAAYDLLATENISPELPPFSSMTSERSAGEKSSPDW